MKRQSTQARKLAIEEEEDDEVRAQYQQDARTATREAAALQLDLSRLRQEDAQVLPATFKSEVDYLIRGLATIARGNVAPRDERHALHTVIEDFRIEECGDAARWTLHLLVPADGRVAVLGPFTDVVPVIGRRVTPAEKKARKNTTADARIRRTLIGQLLDAGFPDCLARAASFAPTTHLARALLNDDVLWPDCADGFDHAAFNRHVRASWPRNGAWSKGIYCHTNPKRQAIVDLVAGLGGQARLDQIEAVAEDLGFQVSDVYPLTDEKTSRNPAIPRWPAPVRRCGAWSAATLAEASIVESIRCPRCGEPATAVVRVPEVPGALLCRRCLVAPAHPDLQFPPLYGDLALPTTRILEEVLVRAQNIPRGARRKGPRTRTGRGPTNS